MVCRLRNTEAKASTGQKRLCACNVALLTGAARAVGLHIKRMQFFRISAASHVKTERFMEHDPHANAYSVIRDEFARCSDPNTVLPIVFSAGGDGSSSSSTLLDQICQYRFNGSASPFQGGNVQQLLRKVDEACSADRVPVILIASHRADLHADFRRNILDTYIHSSGDAAGTLKTAVQRLQDTVTFLCSSYRRRGTEDVHCQISNVEMTLSVHRSSLEACGLQVKTSLMDWQTMFAEDSLSFGIACAAITWLLKDPHDISDLLCSLSDSLRNCVPCELHATVTAAFEHQLEAYSGCSMAGFAESSVYKSLVSTLDRLLGYSVSGGDRAKWQQRMQTLCAVALTQSLWFEEHESTPGNVATTIANLDLLEAIASLLGLQEDLSVIEAAFCFRTVAPDNRSTVEQGLPLDRVRENRDCIARALYQIVMADVLSDFHGDVAAAFSHPTTPPAMSCIRLDLLDLVRPAHRGTGSPVSLNDVLQRFTVDRIVAITLKAMLATVRTSANHGSDSIDQSAYQSQKLAKEDLNAWVSAMQSREHGGFFPFLENICKQMRKGLSKDVWETFSSSRFVRAGEDCVEFASPWSDTRNSVGKVALQNANFRPLDDGKDGLLKSSHLRLLAERGMNSTRSVVEQAVDDQQLVFQNILNAGGHIIVYTLEQGDLRGEQVGDRVLQLLKDTGLLLADSPALSRVFTVRELYKYLQGEVTVIEEVSGEGNAASGIQCTPDEAEAQSLLAHEFRRAGVDEAFYGFSGSTVGLHATGVEMLNQYVQQRRLAEPRSMASTPVGLGCSGSVPQNAACERGLASTGSANDASMGMARDVASVHVSGCTESEEIGLYETASTLKSLDSSLNGSMIVRSDPARAVTAVETPAFMKQPPGVNEYVFDDNDTSTTAYAASSLREKQYSDAGLLGLEKESQARSSLKSNTSVPNTVCSACHSKSSYRSFFRPLLAPSCSRTTEAEWLRLRPEQRLYVQATAALAWATVTQNFALAATLSERLAAIQHQALDTDAHASKPLDLVITSELGAVLKELPDFFHFQTDFIRREDGQAALDRVSALRGSGEGLYQSLGRLYELLDLVHDQETGHGSSISEDTYSELFYLCNKRVQHELFTPPHYRNGELMCRLVEVMSRLWINNPTASMRDAIIHSGVLDLLTALLSQSENSSVVLSCSYFFKAVASCSDEECVRSWFLCGRSTRAFLDTLQRLLLMSADSFAREDSLSIFCLLKCLEQLSTIPTYVQLLCRTHRQLAMQDISGPQLLLSALLVDGDSKTTSLTCRLLGRLAPYLMCHVGQQTSVIEILQTLVRFALRTEVQLVHDVVYAIVEIHHYCKTNLSQEQLQNQAVLDGEGQSESDPEAVLAVTQEIEERSFVELGFILFRHFLLNYPRKRAFRVYTHTLIAVLSRSSQAVANLGDLCTSISGGGSVSSVSVAPLLDAVEAFHEGHVESLMKWAQQVAEQNPMGYSIVVRSCDRYGFDAYEKSEEEEGQVSSGTPLNPDDVIVSMDNLQGRSTGDTKLYTKPHSAIHAPSPQLEPSSSAIGLDFSEYSSSTKGKSSSSKLFPDADSTISPSRRVDTSQLF